MKYFVKDNATKYQILVYNDKCNFAASILQKYIFESSGAKLEIVDKNTSNCIFKIGFNKINSNNGKVICHIDGNDIYLDGDGEKGEINAVIEFLKRTVNFDVFDIDNVHVDRKNNICLCKNFEVTPSFQYRFATYGWIRNNDTIRSLMRMDLPREVFMTKDIYHNALDILKYNNTEIKDAFLNEKKNQICYSNKDALKLFISNLRTMINDNYKNSSLDYFMLGMEDNCDWCGCDECKNKNQSNVMIKFINQVAKEINDERLIKNKKAIKFLVFAYYNTLKAPNIELNENVGVYFAPIKARFRKPLNNKDNVEYFNSLKTWSSKTNSLFAWTYSFYTRRNFLMYDTFSSIRKNYLILQRNNVIGLYDQTVSYAENEPGFAKLKAYIQSHLLWNSEENINRLIKRFFKAEFGNFSKSMLAIFNKTRKEFNKLYKLEMINPLVKYAEENPNKYSEIGQCVDKFNCLKIESIKANFGSFLNNVIIQMNSMLNSCESDNLLYNKIKLELISYRYMKLLVIDKENENEFLQLFKDMQDFKILYIQEGKKVETIDNLKL